MINLVFCIGEGLASCSSSEASGLSLDGLKTREAKEKTIAWLEDKQCGSRKTDYKLRDWLFARQRYWGEPFPVSFPEGSTVRLCSQKLLQRCCIHPVHQNHILKINKLLL